MKNQDNDKLARRSRLTKVGLYDPYLDVLGGGEKYLLQMLSTCEEMGYQPTIFWNKNLQKEISQRLNINFRSLTFEKNIFIDPSIHSFQRFLKLKEFDVFLYISDGSYFFSGARRNIVHAMVPLKNLYLSSSLNRIKHLNWSFVANSYFTQSHLKNWGVNSTVLYPYLDKNFLEAPIKKKEQIILSVGRFFGHLHSKNHERMIDVFLKNKKLSNGYTLVLAGGLKDEDREYFESLKEKIGDVKNIILKPNVSYDELLGLYLKARYYWHFAGFGINDVSHPELVEHFGITPIEAMAMRVIPFCFNAGGPKELIADGVNGFLFNDEAELIGKMSSVMNDEKKQNEIAENAHNYALKNFSLEVYKQNLKKLI
ncbi:MAG: glycosyltransferase family 4 protein [Microgenomates group bacterium]